MADREKFVTAVSRNLYELGGVASFYDKPFVLERKKNGTEWLCRFGERFMRVTGHTALELLQDMADVIRQEEME